MRQLLPRRPLDELRVRFTLQARLVQQLEQRMQTMQSLYEALATNLSEATVQPETMDKTLGEND